VPDPKLILCYRQAGRQAKDGSAVLYEQLVAYVV
jgi:hypothetical protein